MNNNLDIITQWIEGVIAREWNKTSLNTIIQTATELKSTFPINNEECKLLVSIVEQKLQDILNNHSWECMTQLELKLNKNEKGNTDIAVFMISWKKISTILWEILNWKEACETMNNISEKMKRSNIEYRRKSALSAQEIKKVYIS